MHIGSRPARRPLLGLGLGVVAVLALGACGSDDGSTTQPSISATLLSAPPAALIPTSTSSTSTAAPSRSTAAVPSTTGRGVTTTAFGVAPVPTSPPTEPTGVPGGTSDVAMCRDYATVVGTQSVLTIAGAFGDLDATALARLELISAPSVVAAAGALAGEWPAELAAEQAGVQLAVVGPIVQRAERALAAVQASAIDTAPLITAWQTTLTTYDPSNPNVTVSGLPVATETSLATAAASYAATATRYDLDPSVLRTAATPLTTAYLFDQCPELSYLIAGDAE